MLLVNIYSNKSRKKRQFLNAGDFPRLFTTVYAFTLESFKYPKLHQTDYKYFDSYLIPPIGSERFSALVEDVRGLYRIVYNIVCDSFCPKVLNRFIVCKPMRVIGQDYCVEKCEMS